ncbi:hepatitis A virus cellular receptor 2 [Cricetulus griseus]
MCWGRGACFSDKCKDAVILTNGYYVYYERNNRYHLTGKILQGNVSLTIEKVNESDSGLYCCQVEMKQWNVVQTLTISLRIQPGSDPTRNPPTMTKGFYIGIPITLMLLLLVSIMVITRSLEDAVIVEVGKNAYVPCSYTLPTPATPVPVCWGKGPCPWSQCGNGVLSTDERNVTYQTSRRYQLRGNFLKGDVSLTIENVTVDDHGIYCCRVEFPGLWNDKKLDLKLVITPSE